MTLNFYTLGVLYLVYSFLGWVGETVVATFRGKRFANRGMAAGPFCFVYGTTAILMAVGFADMRTKPVALFVACMLTATVVEWLTAKLLERLHNVVSNDFGRVSYTEAVDILMKSGKKFDYPVQWGIDLQTEHERYLTEEVYKKPIFVTDYPKDIKASYMRLNDDGKTVAAADCLVPGVGEIIGGSQREERLDVLLDRIHELGLKEEDYSWYLDLRRYGGTHHAGYGLGFERLIMYITGISNIRDVLPFPRTTGSADF